jgi:hypothetical protein
LQSRYQSSPSDEYVHAQNASRHASESQVLSYSHIPESCNLHTPDSSTSEDSFAQPNKLRDERFGSPGDAVDYPASGFPYHQPCLNGNFDGLLPEVETFFDPSSARFAEIPPLMHPDFRSSWLDWLDFDVPDFPVDGPNLGVSDDMNIDPHSPVSANLQLRNGAQNPVRMSGAEASCVTRTARNSPTLRPIEPQYIVQQWPFDHSQDYISQRYLLPPLRDVLQTSYTQNRATRNEILDRVVQLLSETRFPDPNLIRDANMSQAVGLLRHLLDTYFNRFHDIQPIIHVATWSISGCPSILLAAMACVGAMLSEEEGHFELSTSLSEICIPMITWLVSVHVSRENLSLALSL